jgi:DNA-directed RNA polymerase subunit RPC12/RpoP
MIDPFEEFLEYDFTMGGDTIKCPECSTEVPYSLFFDNKTKCPKCGKEIEIDG